MHLFLVAMCSPTCKFTVKFATNLSSWNVIVFHYYHSLRLPVVVLKKLRQSTATGVVSHYCLIM